MRGRGPPLPCQGNLGDSKENEAELCSGAEMHIHPDSLAALPCHATKQGISRGNSESAACQGDDKLHLQERKESCHHSSQQVPSES